MKKEEKYYHKIIAPNGVGGLPEGIALDDAATVGQLGNVGSTQITKTTIAGIRALSGAIPSNTIYYTIDQGKEGHWRLDTTDTTSLDNTGTILVTSDGKRFKRIFEGDLNVKWFGATGDSNTDDIVAIQNALNVAQNLNTYLYLPSGTYKITDNISSIGKSVLIKGDNATITNYSQKWAIDVEGNSLSFFTIGSVTTEVLTNEEGNQNIVNVLNTSTPQTLINGDVIKLVSDDELQYSMPDATFGSRKTGEYAIVNYVSGNKIYLTGKLRETTYTVNVRAVKIDRVAFEISGIKFTEPDQDVNTVGVGSAIRASYFIEPVFKDLYFENLRAVGIQIQSCFSSKISYIKGKNLKGASEQGHFGYLINDVCGEGTIVTFVSATNVRHLYTTNTYIAQPSSDIPALKFSGRTYNVIVNSCYGFSCHNSPFDVHECAQNINFINCHSSFTRFGKTSQGSGFNFRALDITATGCTSNSDQIGFVIHEAFLNTVYRCNIIDCRVLNARQSAIRTRAFSTATLDTKTRDNIVSGGYFHSLGDYVVDARYTNIRFESGAKFILETNTNNTGVFFLNNKTIVEIDDIFIDLTKSTGTGISSFYATGDNTAISGKTIDIKRTGLNNYAGLVNGANRTGQVISLTGIKDDGNVLGTYSFTNLPSDAQYKVSIESANASTSLPYITFTEAAPNPLFDFNRSANREVTIICLLNGTNQAYTLPVLTPSLLGQVINIVVINQTGSGNTLLVRNGSSFGTRITGGNNITLKANDFGSISFVDRGAYYVSIGLDNNDKEDKSNKATSFTSPNNTTYPTTLAVQNLVQVGNYVNIGNISLSLGGYHTFTGNTATWILPVISGNVGKRFVIMNQGTGTLTINTNAGANDIYMSGSSVNMITIGVGEIAVLYNNSISWFRQL